MTTPMDEINESIDAFEHTLYQLLKSFYDQTGCYVKSIKLNHQYHQQEYESTRIEDIGVGLIPEPFFTKGSKNDDT